MTETLQPDPLCKHGISIFELCAECLDEEVALPSPASETCWCRDPEQLNRWRQANYDSGYAEASETPGPGEADR